MQDGLLSFMITEKNQEIKWREASEDEFEYIKEKYARPTAAITVGIAFSLILMIATVGFVIYCNIINHNAGVIICSIIVYLVMLILIVATGYILFADIRRLNCIYRKRFLVSDATVRNKSVRMRSRGKTSVTIQFVTTTGVQLCARSNGLKPLAEKGKSALILYFGKNEKNNWKYVVKE